MAQPQQIDPLTDDELLSVASDPAMVAKFTSEERRRLTRLQPPPGSERTRVDTNTIGIDHDKVAQSIANWASTLRPGLQRPAAMLATFPADVLASLVEMLSAPESVAAAGARPSMAAMDAVGNARSALSKPADVALEALMKRTGVDADALNLKATQMRLQAARSRTRQAKALNSLADTNAATSPAESVSGGTPPPAGPPPESVPAGTKSPQAMLNDEAIARRRAAYQAKQAKPDAPSAAEPKAIEIPPEVEKEYLRLRAMGKTDQQAKEAILVSLQMNAKLGLKIPTEAETKFPKGMRGRSAPDEP
jgi:hypothetical protein